MNSLQTTIHGSETIIDARKEIEQFFPYQQTLAIIKPGLTPNQKGYGSIRLLTLFEEFIFSLSIFRRNIETIE